MTAPSTSASRLQTAAALLRTSQWTKNSVVLAAFVFALGAHETQVEGADIVRVLAAGALFCLLSSAVYIMNDLRDLERDRAHPHKRNRPLPAGLVAPRTAAGIAAGLGLAALGAAWLLSPGFFAVALAYGVMQVFYSFGLKQVALVDVFVIASGFVLRTLAGAVVLGVEISPWLLLCTLLLALFLGLCKRRHEKVVESLHADSTRPALDSYSEKLLDQLIAIICAATIVCYALYTFWPDTVEKFGTHNLGFTIPFVILGLFRYLDLVYRHDQGGRPEHILLTDRPLMLIIGAYGLTVLGALFLFREGALP